MAALLKNPASMYVGCAGSMFLLYSMAELWAGTLSGSGTKCVMFSWCCVSLVTASILMGIWTSYQTGITDTQTLAFGLLLCVLTLCLSSSITKSAWS